MPLALTITEGQVTFTFTLRRTLDPNELPLCRKEATFTFKKETDNRGWRECIPPSATEQDTRLFLTVEVPYLLTIPPFFIISGRAKLKRNLRRIGCLFHTLRSPFCLPSFLLSHRPASSRRSSFSRHCPPVVPCCFLLEPPSLQSPARNVSPLHAVNVAACVQSVQRGGEVLRAEMNIKCAQRDVEMVPLVGRGVGSLARTRTCHWS